ncbi:hypothetical protein K9U40_24325, partial [Xanthobacter autotrophicus]|uniref:hypothetical protein n=1 Tax=Xanthobacter autotrophicus TaxID=280 RepID=UPI0024ABEEA1
MSVDPAGANGTIRRTGLTGNSIPAAPAPPAWGPCANAAHGKDEPATQKASAFRRDSRWGTDMERAPSFDKYDEKDPKNILNSL